MEFNGWNSLEDLMKACGYTNCNKSSNSTCETSNNNTENNSNNTEYCDIPNGFQSLNPELFIIIGEVLGNIVAGSIPFNVQNAVGNWLQLVGQAILTYNAQQQYFQGGPGRYFNTRYYNITNPFCNTNSTNTNNNNTTKSSNKNNSAKIELLELRINQLESEIEQMKNKVKLNSDEG